MEEETKCSRKLIRVDLREVTERKSLRRLKMAEQRWTQRLLYRVQSQLL